MASLTKGFLRFLQGQTAGGFALALAAVAGLVLANSAWGPAYQRLLLTPGEINIGPGLLVLAKPMLVWVNDLWMAVFFLLVGLEIKREFIKGELASVRQAVLPAVAALGGMAVPAAIYATINAGDPIALRGWAIPTATDIAFAVGALALLGSRVPVSLKVFLTAVAIIDDLGAIVVIALFYTDQLSASMLVGAAACALVLLAMNRAGVKRVDAFIVVGIVLWVCVLKSGVHATLAGVVTALAIPIGRADGGSPAEETEHALHPWVTWLILPTFAFANAGVSFAGVTPAAILEPTTLGIALGLLLGKTIGVFGATWLLVRVGWSERPAGASWVQVLGACILCGIGFTMSLFIGGLAFEGQSADYEVRMKLGVLTGSVIAAILGSLVLLRAGRQVRTP